jgi:hypothetical protein
MADRCKKHKPQEHVCQFPHKKPLVPDKEKRALKLANSFVCQPVPKAWQEFCPPVLKGFFPTV